MPDIKVKNGAWRSLGISLKLMLVSAVCNGALQIDSAQKRENICAIQKEDLYLHRKLWEKA